MGNINNKNKTPSQPTLNRMPIISPKHLPKDIDINETRYAKFDPKRYENKFTFDLKALPKYY